MKRWYIYGLIILLIVVGACVWTVYWSLGTEEGARWLFKTVSRWSPVKIEAREITGRIAGNLYLKELQLRWPKGEVQVGSLEINWQPLYLLSGTFFANKLILQQVKIQDHSPPGKTEPDLSWPKVSLFLTWLGAEVKEFRIDGLVYRQLDHTPFLIERLSTGSLSWRHGLLAIEKITFKTPATFAEGKMELGFLRPSLSLDLHLELTKTVIGLKTFSLKIELQPGHDPEQVAGTVAFVGKSISTEPMRLFSLEGEMGVTRTTIRLRHLLLSEPTRQGTLTGEGEVTFPNMSPFLRMRLKMTDLDFSPELIVSTTVSGEVRIEGEPSLYRGTFNLRNRKEDWRDIRLSGNFQGNLEGINLSILEGSWIDGTFLGQVKAGWTKGVSLRSEIQVRNFNPARITPEWLGRVNLNLLATFQQPDTGLLEGSLNLRLLESHVRGQALTGGLEAHLSKDVLRISQMNLKGKGFDLSAKGVLQERLTFDADINDLSGLIPGARGSLLSKGWIRWQDRRLEGNFESRGRKLFIAGTEIGAVDFLGRVEDGKDPVVELKSKIHRLKYPSLNLDLVTLNLTGRAAHHSLLVNIQWPQGDLKSSFEGAYKEGAWQGKILRVTGKDAMGSWNLQTPVSLNISPQKFQFTSLVITSTKGERLAVSADLVWGRLRGFLSAEWQEIHLAHINPFLGNRNLSGLTTGAFRIRWLEDDRLQLSSRFTAKGVYRDGPFTLKFSQAQAELSWNEAGLQGLWNMDFYENSKFSGTLSSFQPARLAFPEQGSMKVVLENINLMLLQPWLPPTLRLEGLLSGHATGNWSTGAPFDTQGELNISRGIVRWQREEGPISDHIETAQLRWLWRGEQLSGDLSLAFTELGSVKGSFYLPLVARWPLLIHPTGPIQVSLQGNVEQKGLMPTLFPALIHQSRGWLRLSLNASGTWQRPRLIGSLQLADSKIHFLTDQKAKKSIPLNLSGGSLNVDWREKGLSAAIELQLAEGGRFHGNFSSEQSARMAFPEQGKMKAKWEAFDIGLLKSWLPEGFDSDANLSGHLDGQWSADARFSAKGEFMISPGTLQWRIKDGLVKAALQKADLKWLWRDESLRGNFSLSLAEYGHIDGSFQVPFEARLPVVIPPNSPIQLSLDGQVQEKGLLTAFFPGLIRESRGQIDLAVNAHGTWEAPHFEGNLWLSRAGAYFPASGIHLRDLTTRARFAGDQIQIESFQAHSGEGQVEGKATVWLKDWRVLRYQGNLKGERFQTIYLPELKVLSNPRLDFNGTTQKLTLRGEIGLPEVSLLGPQTTDLVRPSPDVVIVDPDKAPKTEPSLTMDIQIRLMLGEKVLVKVEGIDARLTGDVMLNVQDPKAVNASGEIRVAQGHYSVYGQKLEIARGRLIFPGGPVDQPNLDVLALRKIKEVQAGVIVTGTPRTPVVRLYSRPSMPDTDILSYIVLGQPLGGGKEQIPALMQAVGFLLSAGESTVLQGQLKSTLGLDTLDIQASGDGVSRSMVTVGKYLTPDLYISLGRSLVTDTTLVTLRYTLSKRWEVETKTGSETGGTLYFKIELD